MIWRLFSARYTLALGLAHLAQSRDDAAMAALGQRTVNAALEP
jgi:hypothetical protein